MRKVQDVLARTARDLKHITFGRQVALHDSQNCFSIAGCRGCVASVIVGHDVQYIDRYRFEPWIWIMSHPRWPRGSSQVAVRAISADGKSLLGPSRQHRCARRPQVLAKPRRQPLTLDLQPNHHAFMLGSDFASLLEVHGVEAWRPGLFLDPASMNKIQKRFQLQCEQCSIFPKRPHATRPLSGIPARAMQ